MSAYNTNDPVNPAMFKMARIIRGLSLEQVSEKSGLSVQQVEQIELTAQVLDRGILRILCNGYAFPPHFFYQEGEPHEPQFPICYADRHIDEMLAPLQTTLDEWFGEFEIANIEWLDDGIYLCRYKADEDEKPFYKAKLGDTIIGAAKELAKLWKADKRRQEQRPHVNWWAE